MLTLRLTDSPINQCGQGGLMRLVISLIPAVEKKKLRGLGKKENSFFSYPTIKGVSDRETMAFTLHWFWFTSICFNRLLTVTVGSRRAEDTTSVFPWRHLPTNNRWVQELHECCVKVLRMGSPRRGRRWSPKKKKKRAFCVCVCVLCGSASLEHWNYTLWSYLGVK